mmetsp:Transcript_36767/g.68414  ORF Transcript_36767/g.68414 Transcript_36767/m.68414 type:complete len:86 (-) Transcript_36767:33-290(-)
MWANLTGLAVEARLAGTNNLYQLRSNPLVDNVATEEVWVLSQRPISLASFGHILLIVYSWGLAGPASKQAKKPGEALAHGTGKVK